jgi:hypothetical protein
MFLSGKHDYIEPGLKLLAEEFSTGKIIKRVVGQQAYNRLVEFAKPDETWDSLINRLMILRLEQHQKRSSEVHFLLISIYPKYK